MARNAKVKITYISASGSNATADSGSSAVNSNTSTSTSTSRTGKGTYTVKRGDTLWAIAKQYYGSGNKYTIIYDANKDLIETTAKNHGKVNSDHGHWIWPGEVLTIPGISDSSESTDSSGAAATTTAATKSKSMGDNISDKVTSFSYTDVATGKSDSISISIINVDKEWLGDRMPQTGDSVKAVIKTKEWGAGKPSFDCGTFLLDNVSFSGRPLQCVLDAVSVPINIDFKSKKKTVTWQSSTLKDIAQKIAGSAGVKLYYSGASIKISELEQSNETDSSFLYALCEKYGFSMKVYNNKIIIFDTAEAEKQDTVLDLSESDILSWNYDTTIDGTYTGIEFTYNNPDTKDKNNKKIKVVVGKPGRMYYTNSQASSKYDAELQAKALLNKANREIETMEVSIMANNSVVAGQCIRIKGLGKANGVYYIDQIKHSVGSGYKMQLTLHKVYGRSSGKDGTGNGSETASGGTSSTDYTVKRGDTLWAIAKQYYGSGSKYTIIYDANKEVIEATARNHGKPSSDHGHWIWPGEVLKIPGGA